MYIDVEKNMLRQKLLIANKILNILIELQNSIITSLEEYLWLYLLDQVRKFRIVEKSCMKILLTGFEPFNNTDINPSEEIVKSLPDYIEGITLIKEILPVEFKKASKMIKNFLKQHRPNVVISIGQAGNRLEISIERAFINLDCVRSLIREKEKWYLININGIGQLIFMGV